MSTIHPHQTTSLTPEQYIAGLTDFGPGQQLLTPPALLILGPGAFCPKGTDYSALCNGSLSPPLDSHFTASSMSAFSG
jgi:hypothetical protein